MSNQTRAALEARIADDLDRSDLTTQITAAVTDAIDRYASERFAFNEVQNFTHTFSASNAVVPLTNLTVYFAKIDRLRMQYSGASNLTDLYPRDYGWLMDGQDAQSVSRPLEYCVYAEAINFDVIPQEAYVGVLDGVKRLSPTSSNSFSTSSSVSWFTEGRNLIRARAKIDLYAHVIKDTEEAGKMALVEQREFRDLKAKLNTRNSGRIRPTCF